MALKTKQEKQSEIEKAEQILAEERKKREDRAMEKFNAFLKKLKEDDGCIVLPAGKFEGSAFECFFSIKSIK